MNPQQYFLGCALVRYRHLSTSIAYLSRTHLAFAPLRRPLFNNEHDLMNQKLMPTKTGRPNYRKVALAYGKSANHLTPPELGLIVYKGKRVVTVKCAFVDLATS
jgi:hypothetical protein